MFLLAPPFVSDILIQTLQDHSYLIVKTEEAFGMLGQIEGLHWMSEQDAIKKLQTELGPVYSNSENALAWLQQHVPEHPISRQSEVFKDKARFRELIRSLYPDYYFERISVSDLPQMAEKPLPYPVIVKPVRGFFSIGVHRVDCAEDWQPLIQAYSEQSEENIYPDSVLSSVELVVEGFIKGEEFAVDAYFDGEGKAVISNLLHHRFADEEDTSDRLYSTSKQIIESHLADFEALIQKIGEALDLTYYPFHIEVRVSDDGQIIPIEVNPLRFGGWCTTADLSYFGHGFNAYVAFMEQKRPNWRSIFAGKEHKKQSIVVLNNSTGYKRAEIASFDYQRLTADFSSVLCLRDLDIAQWPLFGFLFVETDPDEELLLQRLLVDDLRAYCRLNNESIASV